MTRSDDPLGDLHLPPRGADMKDYQDHTTPGWRQLLCACFIVLTVAALFKISDFISANRTAPFARATELAQMADVEQAREIERWERGESRHWTMRVPYPHKVVLASRLVDQ